MGLQEEKLPEITPSDQIVGAITREAARQTALSEGTPVICGGGDFAFACLSAGVLNNNQGAIMLGTAGNLMVPNLPRSDSLLLNTHYLNGTTLSLGGVMAGGVLNWFTKSVLGSADKNIFDRLEREALKIPSGANGLVFLPYLMGERSPIWDPQARGVWLGLSSSHHQAHLYRAILEGIGFAFKQIANIIHTSDGELEHVVAMDGGAQSALWRQIIADILDVHVYWYGDTSGTGLGAAFFAAKAMKQVTDLSDIIKWLPSPIMIKPNPGIQTRYTELYSIYANLYTKLASDFHALAKIGS
jgi:xylulokinase